MYVYNLKKKKRGNGSKRLSTYTAVNEFQHTQIYGRSTETKTIIDHHAFYYNTPSKPLQTMHKQKTNEASYIAQWKCTPNSSLSSIDHQ